MSAPPIIRNGLREPQEPAGPRARRVVSLESLTSARLSSERAARCAARATFTVTLAVGRTTLAVHFSRASAARAFSERFAALLAQREPEIVAYVVDTGGVAFFWRSPERAFVWNAEASDELLAFFADGFVMREYFAASPDFGLHAAVVARGTQLAALIGRSTAGKTTTALAAVRRGFAFYSDERCIMQHGRVVPFLRALTLRADGRALLCADTAANDALDRHLRTLPADGDVVVDPRSLIGERAGGPPRPLDVAFLIEGRAEAPVVSRCSLQEALPALLRSSQCRETGLERAARALTELRTLRTYRLQLGTPAATAAAIETTLDEAFAERHG